MKRIAIIGFGSAGFAALMAIRKADPRAEVVIVDPKPFDLMHPCGIPYALEGIVTAEGLYQDVALQSMGATRIRACAKSIDRARKLVIAEGPEGAHEVSYETAIITTGYAPFVPPLKNIDRCLGRGLHTLASVEDLVSITQKTKSIESAIVIGGGAIGLEAAVALKRHAGSVALLEMRDQLLPGVLDADLSETVEKHLAAEGIACRCGTAVEEVLGDDGFRGVVAGGERLEAGLCVLAAGFRANITLAKESDIDTESLGIMVDGSLRTSDENIYAAGDCIAAVSVVDGKKTPAKLATAAYKQGTVAGLNACGAGVAYRGTAGTFVTKVGELEVAGTGYNTETATRNGFAPAPGKIKSRLLPDYFPGGGEIIMKMIVDKNSGKILGAQAVGEGAAARINLISMALEFGIGLDDLGRLEMAYCPAVSEVYDPLLRAVDFAARRVKR
ncbi:MAG: FAD-dependent oxidoreductase [Spirochaetes bacterium]|nr:FAD-dependent oxidoreductase [Spirochaetota bacterium]